MKKFEPMTARAEAGAAVRRLVHEYQSAAAFQRRRLRGVVARYRGLDLVVQAHAVFAADLSLALPDGATLDAVTAATDTGIWQSVGNTVNDIPAILERLRRRIAEARERIATIDRELVRLEQWDGQATYGAALSELSAINAIFAAAEEQASAERGEAAATEGMNPLASNVAGEDVALPDVLLALAQEERAAEGWGAWATVIPPAPVSLAWMSAEVERLATQSSPGPEPLVAEEPEADGTLLLATEVGRPRTPGGARVHFGHALAPRRVPRPEAPRPVNAEAEVSQLPLF